LKISTYLKINLNNNISEVNMKNCPLKRLFFYSTMLFIPIFFGLSSCDGSAKVSEQLLTEQEKKAEKMQIIEVINTYIEGANEKN